MFSFSDLPFTASEDKDIMANTITIIILPSQKYLHINSSDQEMSQKPEGCWPAMPHFPPWNNVPTQCAGLWESSWDGSLLWADNDSTPQPYSKRAANGKGASALLHIYFKNYMAHRRPKPRYQSSNEAAKQQHNNKFSLLGWNDTWCRS